MATAKLCGPSSDAQDKTAEVDNEEKSTESGCSPQSFLIYANSARRPPIVVFHGCALYHSPSFPVGERYNMAYKIQLGESKLLLAVLASHGIKEVSMPSPHYNLLWTGCHPKPQLLQDMGPHQRINHFPRSYELTRKDRLYKNIERMQHSKGLKHFNFVPQTFVLPAEYSTFMSTHYRQRGPWIVKPVASSQGRGIYIVNSPTQVPLEEPVVVAKYITNPLLIDGHKCDLRLYVVVTSYDPLVVYLYEEGLVRFAAIKYDETQGNLWNPCMHLCNYSINKYHSDYIKSSDPDVENSGHKWTFSALLRQLEKEHCSTQQLVEDIKDIIIKAIIAGERPIATACQMFVQYRKNCFELFGFDILVDANLKPWLLEVNLCPSLGCDSPLDLKVKMGLVTDMFTLVGIPAIDPYEYEAHLNAGDVVSQSGQLPRASSTSSITRIKKRRTFSLDVLHSSGSITTEDMRVANSLKAEFERKGGYVRIFPCQDSWTKYKDFFELTYQRNRNMHELLFGVNSTCIPEQKSAWFPGIKTKYASMNNLATNSSAGCNLKIFDSKMNVLGAKTPNDEIDKSRSADMKKEVGHLMKQGLELSKYQSRHAFAHYLSQVMVRMKQFDNDDASTLNSICRFLQRACVVLRDPVAAKPLNQFLQVKDKVPVVTKQLHDFLINYNRETEEFFPKQEKSSHIPSKLFKDFLSVASESDVEEILSQQIKLDRNVGYVCLGKCGFPVSPKPSASVLKSCSAEWDKSSHSKAISQTKSKNYLHPIRTGNRLKSAH